MTEEDIEKCSALEKRSKYRCDLIEEMLDVMVNMLRMSLLDREKEILDRAKKIVTSETYSEAKKVVEKI